MNLQLFFVFIIFKLCSSQFIVKPVMINTSILIPRIVKGRAAKLGELPYQVSLRKMTSRTYHQYTTFCGGVLITRSKILTAAHCFALKKNMFDSDCGRKFRELSKSDLKAVAVAGNIQTVAIHPNPPKKTKTKVKVPKVPLRTNDTPPHERRKSNVIIPKTTLSTTTCTSSNDGDDNQNSFTNSISQNKGDSNQHNSTNCISQNKGDSNQNNSTNCTSPNFEEALTIVGNQPNSASPDGRKALTIGSNQPVPIDFTSPTREKALAISSNHPRFKRNGETTEKPAKTTRTPRPATEFGQWRSLKSGFYPRNYKFPKADICVLITARRFNIDPNVATIPYATSNKEYPTNMTCVASGYGKIGHSKNASTTGVLLMANFETIPTYYCNQLHKKNMEKFVCTSGKISDTATGDSGGPLVCKNTGDKKEKEKGLLIGIVSGHKTNVGSFFTRVSSYKSFIQKAAATRISNSVIFILVIYEALWLF